jgi:hypothetical protein
MMKSTFFITSKQRNSYFVNLQKKAEDIDKFEDTYRLTVLL